jgi:xylulokinase
MSDKETAMLIGIDVGTSAVKAALFDMNGNVIRSFSERYPTIRPAPGHVEQDPRDWTRLVYRALAELEERDQVGAVGICSQVNTHVFADDKGEALLSALSWQDTRCAIDAMAIDEKVTADDKIRWWGAPLPVDASHILARMAFIARSAPDLWARTSLVLAPKDYCIFHLTGEAVADPMTSFGILDQRLALIDPLMDLVPGAALRLPRMSGFTSPAGRIRPGLPCAGVPVVTGTMDAWSGLLGAGVSEDGEGVYLSGTSEILGILSHKRHPTAGVISFAECEGIVLHAGPTQSGGASVEWLARLISKSITEVFDLACKADIRHVPLFMPHLDGERAPLWDASARGSFTGLTSATGAAELSLAVLEGVAYSARLVFDSLARSAGREADVIHHAGGGATSDLWCQVRSDVLGRPLRRTVMRDAGVLGAALMAGVGTGRYSTLQEATRHFVQFDSEFTSRAENGPRHGERYEAYGQTYEQLRPIHLSRK